MEEEEDKPKGMAVLAAYNTVFRTPFYHSRFDRGGTGLDLSLVCAAAARLSMVVYSLSTGMPSPAIEVDCLLVDKLAHRLFGSKPEAAGARGREKQKETEIKTSETSKTGRSKGLDGVLGPESKGVRGGDGDAGSEVDKAEGFESAYASVYQTALRRGPSNREQYLYEQVCVCVCVCVCV